MTDVVRYGVLEQTKVASEVERFAEQVRLNGFAVVPSAYSPGEIAGLRERLLLCLERQTEANGGREALQAIGEADTVRAPLLYDDAFLGVARQPDILAIMKEMLGPYVTLMQQNGIVSRPTAKHHQAAYHRDLPYQHFVTSRPIAMNALLCLDEFTPERGSTRMLAGSHRSERFPSDAFVKAMEVPINAPAGSYLVFDSMVYHRSGANVTNSLRCAVNNMYTLPFVKQQISLPAVLKGKWADDPELARFLGYETEAAASVEDYYTARRKRLKH
jgi:ectoine hydroxylase-related dioxygenase (phytanoyl-CoA dioxygenase family)